MLEIEKIKKSGIMTWNEENIRQTPVGLGVYILTNSPINGSAVNLKIANNLQVELLDLFQTGQSDISFFYWYETKDTTEAQELLIFLKDKYGIMDES